MLAMKIEGLNKSYDKFQLKNVSFDLEKGFVMGFIGSNGAGKTTTLKSILNMVHADSGKVTILGQDFSNNEIALKQKIGYMFGETDFYSRKKVKVITDVVKRFYTDWDDGVYNDCLKRFKIDQNKKIAELSSGMKVKYSLTLALSHNAKLFLLDEPTSGLDPVARDDLLELFQELVEDGEKSILFSTHITSDLEKCADHITYINNGKIVASSIKDDFLNSYRIVKGRKEQMIDGFDKHFISYKSNSFGFTGLIKTKDISNDRDLITEPANLEEIMIYHARMEKNYEKSNI